MVKRDYSKRIKLLEARIFNLKWLLNESGRELDQDVYEDIKILIRRYRRTMETLIFYQTSGKEPNYKRRGMPKFVCGDNGRGSNFTPKKAVLIKMGKQEE